MLHFSVTGHIHGHNLKLVGFSIGQKEAYGAIRQFAGHNQERFDVVSKGKLQRRKELLGIVNFQIAD